MLRAYKDLNPTTKQWLQTLYEGNGPFKLRNMVDTYEVAKALQFRTIETRRRALERVWTPRIYSLLAKVGRSTAINYADNQNLLIAVTHMNRELQEPIRQLYWAMFHDIQSVFVKLVPKEVTRVGKSASQPSSAKADDFEEFDPEDWQLVDPFDLPKMQAYNRLVIAARVVGFTSTMTRWLSALVLQALREGWSVDTVAQKIRDHYGFSLRRATLIAQTEVVGGSNAATFYSLDANAPTGQMTKDWLNAGDHRVRDTHVEAGLQQRDIPFRDPFEVGGSYLMFPGDSSMNAAGKEVIGCRCTALYQTPGSRRDRIDQRLDAISQRAGR